MKVKRATFRYKMNAWKHHAKARNIEFTLTDEDILSLPLVCHYSGVPLTMKAGESNVASLDRINNNLGYVPGNVAFCTRWINLMKKNKSVEEFVEMCRKVVEHTSKTS